MKDNISDFFWLKPCILWARRAHQSDIFQLLIGWVKINQVPYIVFETTRQFFFKLLTTIMRSNCTFLAETLYDLD